MVQLFLWALTVLSILLFVYSRTYRMNLIYKIVKGRKATRLDYYKAKSECLLDIGKYSAVIITAANFIKLLQRGYSSVLLITVGITGYVVYLICVIFGIKSMWGVVRIVQYRVARKYQ